jgi:hypothetical protein
MEIRIIENDVYNQLFKQDFNPPCPHNIVYKFPMIFSLVYFFGMLYAHSKAVKDIMQ